MILPDIGLLRSQEPYRFLAKSPMAN